MASESEQGHVGCTAKRRTRLARPAFVGRSVKSLTNSNRRIRNRTYGGVGGADERLSPLSRSRGLVGEGSPDRLALSLSGERFEIGSPNLFRFEAPSAEEI